MAYQRFDGTMSFVPSRFEAQAMLFEMQKKKDEEMKLLQLKQTEHQFMLEMSKQLEEQKLRTKALKSMLDNLVESQTKVSKSFIQPIRGVESNPSTPMTPSQSPQPPDPPDIRKSRQDLTIKAPDLPDFNQFELISMNQVPNKLTVRYSCEEIHERMKNGLCIFCEDLDTPGHYNLKHKRSKLCLVECVDDGLPDAELVEPAVEQISNESINMIREKESSPENESRPEMSVSQFQSTIMLLLICMKLMLDSSKEDNLVPFLVSLTKLSSRSTLLASELAEVIRGEDRTSHVRAAVLRCLPFLTK